MPSVNAMTVSMVTMPDWLLGEVTTWMESANLTKLTFNKNDDRITLEYGAFERRTVRCARVSLDD